MFKILKLLVYDYGIFLLVFRILWYVSTSYTSLLFFLKFIYFNFCLHWVFVAAHGPSLVVVSGGHSSPQCAGPPLRWFLLLRSMDSRRVGFSNCGSHAPEHRLSNHCTRAQLLHSMCDPPGPGIEPMSPALAGGFPTTAPPGKSLHHYSFVCACFINHWERLKFCSLIGNLFLTSIIFCWSVLF